MKLVVNLKTAKALGLLVALEAERQAFKRELAETQRQLGEVTAMLRELRAAAVARNAARVDIARLTRERMIAWAEATERDPMMPLQ